MAGNGSKIFTTHHFYSFLDRNQEQLMDNAKCFFKNNWWLLLHVFLRKVLVFQSYC